MSFEQEFNLFLEEQRAGAQGQRLEMLNRDLVGERKMFKEVLWPVFQTFEGFVMEYEVVCSTGIRVYVDAYYEPLGLAFESEGFAVHADKVTRERFSFEKRRVRNLAAKRIRYIPFAWDELDKKPDLCRSSLCEILGRYDRASNEGDLSLAEREVLRHALLLGRPFGVCDVMEGSGRGRDVSFKVIKKLISKKWIKPLYTGRTRNHRFVLNRDKVKALF
ncbi:hypothetical protein [Paenibacillus sp. HB172176]|uniref:hypothetical protein n=1 Tax=Paenibacillus sp. HB172176 TaxID=2493690 RepID=UPI0014391053|nr:hypothetical protein [Paenibacillus sp. HB172176]